MTYGNLIVTTWHKVRVIFTKLVSGATRAVTFLMKEARAGKLGNRRRVNRLQRAFALFVIKRSAVPG